MLFSDEARLTEPVEGVASFARTFAARGPRDRAAGRCAISICTTRLFRYPLSYMIYSPAFDALPDAARDRIYRRLFDLLSSDGPHPAVDHLSRAERTAILEIVRDTKPDAPAYWRNRPAR